MARPKLSGLVSFGVGVLCALGTRGFAQTPAEVATAKEKALAVGAGDLNGDGVTDVQDLDILISNLGLSGDAAANQGDLDLDKDVDNDDLAELLSLLSSTIDINSRLIIDRLVEKGLIAFSEPYAQHPQHNAPFSGSGHHKYWSHSHPNHETTVSAGWIPDAPAGHSYSFSLSNPSVMHTVSHSDSWPPNHTESASNTWPILEPIHQLSVSGGWPPRHIQNQSSLWPASHLHPTSRNWGPMHLASFSSSEAPDPIQDHFTATSDSWTPSVHALATSHEQWPPNHVLSISQGWSPRPASHSVAQSRMWPPNHFTAVSIGWPHADNPWPPNHFKTITEGPTNPPAGQ